MKVAVFQIYWSLDKLKKIISDILSVLAIPLLLFPLLRL